MFAQACSSVHCSRRVTGSLGCAAHKYRLPPRPRPAVNVITLLNGTAQETATGGSVWQLQALGLSFDPDATYVEFTTTKPFNSVSVVVGALASALSSVKVYGACVTLQ
jgi:hypothetical protein